MKLLTEDEYREQSNIETRKALEELRRYLMGEEEMVLDLNIRFQILSKSSLKPLENSDQGPEPKQVRLSHVDSSQFMDPQVR